MIFHGSSTESQSQIYSTHAHPVPFVSPTLLPPATFPSEKLSQIRQLSLQLLKVQPGSIVSIGWPYLPAYNLHGRPAYVTFCENSTGTSTCMIVWIVCFKMMQRQKLEGLNKGLWCFPSKTLGSNLRNPLLVSMVPKLLPSEMAQLSRSKNREILPSPVACGRTGTFCSSGTFCCNLSSSSELNDWLRMASHT